MKSVDAVDGDDNDDDNNDDHNDDADDNNDNGDRLFTSTLVAAVEALRGHLATYSDLPAYIRKWMPGSRKEQRVRFSNDMLEVMCLGSVGLCVCH